MKEVLRWVNSKRVKYGQKPIEKLKKGEIGRLDTCVIANSLKGRVIKEPLISNKEISFWVKNEELRIKTPKLIQRFISRFDANKYPKLVR